MADYNRTIWKDHIKDQDGKVIQQGVPVSAKNLNNIENQLVVLSAKENTLAELVRESIPSGFTTLSDLDYSYMSTNPNTIRLVSDSIAFVNGYKVVIPAGTVIQLDAPPTSGSRDDLVFLECWKQTDANGSVTWNWRIRTVSGVDFGKYTEGFHTNGTSWDRDQTTPQGGNTSPITTTSSNWALYNYNSAAPYGSRNWTINDAGLYVSGTGDSASRTTLATTDGYAYAIPMFRVHRRNSGGYSANNGNGGSVSTRTTISLSPNISLYETRQITVSAPLYSLLVVGDILKDSNNGDKPVLRVVSIDGNNKITVFGLSSYSSFICYKYDRNDKLFADIIADRDIIDLRHQVSLTGFNYQQLLEENFDKLLRGDLQTNAKTTMLKTYHGIPKTPIDSNTVFYASFDGTTVAEVGGSPLATSGTPSYGPAVTGLGLNTKATKINYSLSINSQVMTIDVFLSRKDELADYSFYPVNILDRNSNLILCIDNRGNSMRFVMNGTTVLAVTPALSKEAAQHHLRLIVRDNSLTTAAYVDGKFIGNGSYASPIINLIASIMVNNGSSASNSVVSDLSISNIDKGANFATLPQDFIDGYARIMQAFNEQRNVFSDALTSETEFVQVKCAGGNGKVIALGDATDWAKDDGTKWNSGDRIKVKGLSGEIISGVIDTDTAVARILNYTSPITVQLDDVSKISVGDTLYFYKPDLSYSSAFSITAVDTTAKTVTINATSNFEGTWIGGYVFETTASSSSPKVQYYNGSTITDLTGTWSGLGTNEATFTLGTNSNLSNQDIYITYGLNELPGQGGIPEVITTTLGGESNGKRLTVNPSVQVRDDFAGKVSGSTAINPNIAMRGSYDSLKAPSYFSYEDESSIDTLNNITKSQSTSVNGQIPQQLFSFNIIRILEDKFGQLPCGNDITSKVAWLKANIKSIVCNWWGYGSCPSGNKGYLQCWDPTLSSWTGSHTNTTNIISLVSDYWLSNRIDTNGFIHFLAYTDASDGITPSTIYTDYVNIEIALNSGAGYDVLAPENPRRDDGKSNILLVRKETKEIVTMFPRGNNDKIITYGDYNPFNGLASSPGILKAISNDILITTGGTGGYKTNSDISIMSTLYRLVGNAANLYECSNEEILKAFNLNFAGSNNLYKSVLSYWGGRKYNAIGSNTAALDVFYIITSDIKCTTYYGIYYALKSINGELHLIIRSEKFINGSRVNVYYHYDFKLTNRPLIK